jgi:GT2 family glycosyltransferase
MNLIGGLKVVLCLRNPLEVALSLRGRGLCSYSIGLSLWMTYYQRVLASTRPEDRVVTHYASYFPDPRPELRRIAAFLGLRVTDDMLEKVAPSVKTALRHNRFTTQHLFEVGVAPEIIQVYLELCKEAAWSEEETEPSTTVNSPPGELLQGVNPVVEGQGEVVTTRREGEPPGRMLDFLALEIERLRRDAKGLVETLDNREARIKDLQAGLEGAQAKAQRDAEQVRALEAQLREQARLHEARAQRDAEQVGALEAQLREQAEREASAAQWREDMVNRLDDVHASLCALHAARAPAQNGDISLGKQEGGYRQLVLQVRKLVRSHVPENSTVLVISKGGEELVSLYGRRGWHFPRNEDGLYAGYYPHNGSAAVVHLEWLRAQGADFLLVPESAKWWLEKYPEFRKHLERRYRALGGQESNCWLFALREHLPEGRLHDLLAECQQGLEHDPSILDWNSGLDLAGLFPEHSIFSPASPGETLPYLDRSIDVVVVGSGDEGALAEARRVATRAVVVITPRVEEREWGIQFEWLNDGEAGGMPTVSILIPACREAKYTSACLGSILETLPSKFKGEIVIVSREGDEEIDAQLEDWAMSRSGLRIVWVAPGEDLFPATMRAAAGATGEILVFMENDTVPLAGWLLPILQTFRDCPDAGVVGPKVVFPDGALAEAGGIVFRDGTAFAVGRGYRGEADARLDCLREVDYCPAACLATRRGLFAEAGGFDADLQPSDLVAVDYCFTAKGKGYKTYFQPDSCVAHLGAAAAPAGGGGAQSSGLVAPANFREKWSVLLERQPSAPAEVGAGERILLGMVR